MPQWLKVILGIVLFFFVVFVGVVFYGVSWMRRNEPRLKKEATQARSEGESFGRGKEASACLDEGIRRYRDDPGFTAQIRNRIFMEGCFDAASFPAGYCENVPRQTEFIASAQWALKECQKRGMPNDQQCAKVVMTVIQRCDKQRSSR